MERLLNALAHDHFVSLVNHRNHWCLTHLAADGLTQAALTSRTLDNLLEVFQDVIDKIDDLKARYTVSIPDEGVEEMTAGIAPNPPGEVAYEPLQPHLHK